MRVFERFDRAVNAISMCAAVLGTVILVGAFFMILIEIVMRSLFGTSLNLVEEYVAYGLGAMVFLALARALRVGALVRVDLLLGKLHGRTRLAVEIFACAATLGVMSLMSYFVILRTIRDYSRGTISMTVAATPMWIPHAIVAAGMLIFMLEVISYTLRLFFGGPIIRDQGAVEQA